MSGDDPDPVRGHLRELYELVKHLNPALLTSNHDRRIKEVLDKSPDDAPSIGASMIIRRVGDLEFPKKVVVVGRGWDLGRRKLIVSPPEAKMTRYELTRRPDGDWDLEAQGVPTVWRIA